MPGRPPKDVSGMKFGKLTAIKAVGKNSKGEYQWECICDCGNRKNVNVSNLLLGRTTSCGCSRLTHGMSKTALYFRWKPMRQRCQNDKHPKYKDYGGRGIQVCKEWAESFGSFYQWAIENGYKKGLHLDRINNDAGYSPDNCRWVTALQNENNKRSNHVVSFNGEIHTLAEWSRITGIPETTIWTRLNKGLPTEEALGRKDKKLWQQEQ